METKFTRTFMMRIEDRFDIAGKGVVVTGQVAVGEVKVGESVCLTDSCGNIKIVKIRGIEQFSKQLDYACSGSNIGVVLEGITKSEISSGDLLYKISIK